MEHARYEAMVEEAIGIKRRNRRDQTRQMLLIKEAKDGDVLTQFCTDINISLAAASNYLAAYDKFLEIGIVPGSGEGVDGLIAEMWEDVFDPTLNDTRYSGIDHAALEAAAAEAGLKGSTKAKDIAKNPKSMKVAIIADPRAAQAAIEAITTLMGQDPEIRHQMQGAVLDQWKDEGHTGSGGFGSSSHKYLTDDELCWKIFDRLSNANRAVLDLDVPEHLVPLSLERARANRVVIDQTITVLEGRLTLESI